MRAGSPVDSSRGRLPNLVIDDDDDDRKSQIQTSGGEDRSVGAWLSRVVRGRSDSHGSGRSGRSGLSGQGRYTPVGQQEDGNESGNANTR